MGIPTHMVETVSELQQATNEIRGTEDTQVFNAFTRLYTVREQVKTACAAGDIEKFDKILKDTGYFPLAWKGFFGVNAKTPTLIFDVLITRFAFGPEDEKYVLDQCLSVGNQNLFNHAKSKFAVENSMVGARLGSDSDSDDSDEE